MKSVEKRAPFNAFAREPEWTQDGDVLRLVCGGRSLACRIVFE